MFKRLIFTGVIIYLMLLALITVFQEKLIFFPSTLHQDYEYSFSEPFEEVNLVAEDGAVLNALHFKAENPQGVILYFHGNAGDLSRWGQITSSFTKYNYDVLVMDYRTFGKSTGKLSEEALYEDAQLFYDYLKKSYPEDEIVLYGRSLGSVFATSIASANNPKKLILESPFYNLTSIAKQQYPIFPVKYLLKYRFPTNDFMEDVTSELTIIHGTRDEVIPFSSGKKLFDSAPMNRKHFVAVQGGSHNNLSDFEEYHSAIESVLK